MSLFKSNMEVLREKRPMVADMIKNVKSVTPVKDEGETRKNAIEAVNFLGDTATEGVFLIMGIGKGYFTHVLSSKITKGHVLVVYEPNPGIFKHVLHYVDLTSMIADDRVFLVVGDPDNYSFVHFCHTRMFNGHLWVVRHKNFVNGDQEKCKQFYTRFKEEKRLADINVGTQVGLGKTFMNSILENIPAIIHNNGVASLKSLCKDKPVLVVASGPSIDNQVEDIRRLAKGMTVIACDTALPFLLSHDIIPDLVAGIDPLADNNALFRDPRCKDIPLVCMAQYTPQVVSEYPGPIYFSSQPGNQIFQWLQWYWDDKGSIDTFGGSVSHFSFGIAEYMEASTIYLVGHDYCYFDKWYCGDTSQMLHDEMGKVVPNETIGAIPEVNVNGDSVWTKATLSSFKTALENKLTVHEGAVINLSTGLPITGTTWQDIATIQLVESKQPLTITNSSNSYQLKELIRAIKLGIHIFTRITKYSHKIIIRIHQAIDLRQQGELSKCRSILKRIEKMRHYTLHPLLDIIAGYHTILDLYLQRQDIQDIDTIEDEWERRDAQMSRGLNYYGELIEAINLLQVNLQSLLTKLKRTK